MPSNDDNAIDDVYHGCFGAFVGLFMIVTLPISVVIQFLIKPSY